MCVYAFLVFANKYHLAEMAENDTCRIAGTNGKGTHLL